MRKKWPRLATACPAIQAACRTAGAPSLTKPAGLVALARTRLTYGPAARRLPKGKCFPTPE
jgi:hypothetical protein